MRLHEYQKEGRDFLLRRLHRDGGAGLWFEPGLGKTATTLDTIMVLKELGEIKSTTIIAPGRVIATAWPKEIKKWGLPLTWGWLKGDEEERLSVAHSRPDIFFISAENLPFRALSDAAAAKRRFPQLSEWLLKKGFRTDLLVVDESTKFKNWSASRSKVLRKLVKRIPKRITLTGSPAPNGLTDIFSQHYLLDEGKTLTPYITRFREQFCRPCGYESRNWEVRPEMVGTLQSLLAPWYLPGTAVEHLDMPVLLRNEIEVELPPKAKQIYKDMQKEMFAELDDTSITALSGSSRYTLCRQIASGNAYDDDHLPTSVHDAKLDALESLFEELGGKRLLVAYWYDHEYKRILQRFPKAAVIRGGVSPAKTAAIIDDWKAERINMIVTQAGSVSHGVDGLQEGCNDLVWYTLTDQPEVWTQFERRVFRQGVQGDQVRIHYLLAMSTLDRTVYRVLQGKAATERDIMAAIKELGK